MKNIIVLSLTLISLIALTNCTRSVVNVNKAKTREAASLPVNYSWFIS